MILRLRLGGIRKQTVNTIVTSSHQLEAPKNMSGSDNADIAGMRKPYKGQNEYFDIEHLFSKEPFGQFKHWFEIACKTDGIMEANAMALSTATKEGKPSSRMVLMKGFDKEGFKFFTNYESRKGQDLAQNPVASLMLFWEPLMRMVRVEGTVEKLSEEESTEYYHSRPKESQIGAWVSHQSTVIPSRQTLTDKNAELTKEYANKECPKPPHWGGYILRPETFEFWQGQTNRLHDRFLFRKPQPGEEINKEVTHEGDDGWVFERLSS